MKEKDSIHKNVVFESDGMQGTKFQPLVDKHCRQTLNKLIKNEQMMNKKVHKTVVESTVKKMDKI